MLRDLELIVELQGIDLKAAGLRKEIAALPKEIIAIEKTLESHKRKLDADRALLAGNQKERRQNDGDIQTHQQKISKLREQMSGAKNNEQYRAFQNEITFVEAQIKKCEDRTLELMEEAERLDKNVQAAEAHFSAEKARVDALKAEATQRTAQVQQQVDDLVAQRKEIAPTIAPGALATYERLMKRYGIAVADASNGRCDSCHLTIRPQLYQDVRKRDRIITCETCNRILFYNPPVTFDTQNSGAAPVTFGGGTRVDMT